MDSDIEEYIRKNKNVVIRDTIYGHEEYDYDDVTLELYENEKTDKFNYIVKTLARTKRKDYENYVINRIWNKIDDLDIKPVSQQYVKRKNGSYALIDLYFPQFNIGIECDEFHHIQEKNEKGFTPDELRTEDIISAIEDYEEIRVPIYDEFGKYRDIEEVNQAIDEIAEIIKKRKSEMKNFEAWTNERDVLRAKKQGFITTSNRFFFRINGEIRDFFGLGAKNGRLSFYKIKGRDDYLWLPHLAIQDGDKIFAATLAGHINLYDGKDKILEYVKYDDTVDVNKIDRENKSVEQFRRITFARSRDSLGFTGYRFIGVFQKTGEVEEKEINGQKLVFRVHKKVADKVSSTD